MRLASSKVRYIGIHPAVTEASLHVIDPMCHDWLSYEMIVTSANDSTHSPASRHYAGLALDFRTWLTLTNHVQIPMEYKQEFVEAIRKELGNKYFLLAEPSHIHFSYKPGAPTGIQL